MINLKTFVGHMVPFVYNLKKKCPFHPRKEKKITSQTNSITTICTSHTNLWGSLVGNLLVFKMKSIQYGLHST